MKKIGILIILLLVSTLCQASINVSPMTITMWPNQRPVKDIIVKNSSNDKAYVTIQVKRLEHPGTPQQKEIFIKDPNKFGLLVSPAKLIIAPHAHKRIRVIATIPPGKQERVYRINVAPTVGKAKLHGISENIAAGIKTLIAYSVRTIVLPKNPKPVLSLKRIKKQLTVTNRGNTNVLLYEGKQCDNSGKNCKTFPARRMYANNSWVLTVPYQTSVSFKQVDLDNNTITIHSN